MNILDSSIKKRLLENPISKEEKAFLRRFMALNKENDVLCKRGINNQNIIDDLLVLNTFLSKGTDTSLTASRLKEELELVQRLYDIKDDQEALIDIYYEVEKLYTECSLKSKNGSAVLEKVSAGRVK